MQRGSVDGASNPATANFQGDPPNGNALGKDPNRRYFWGRCMQMDRRGKHETNGGAQKRGAARTAAAAVAIAAMMLERGGESWVELSRKTLSNPFKLSENPY